LGQVRLYATLRQRTDGEGAVEVPWSAGDTIGNVMAELLRRQPALDGCILDEGGAVLPHVSIFLDGRDIRHLDGLESRVDRDTDISVFPPVAGG
jgi:molybdopterin synthase sulfur carrier subunit